MARAYQHFSLEMSLYSGKTRAYLRHKDLPFADRPVRLWTGVRLYRIVNAMVIPVLRTPQGEWLQDTAHIIDTLEARHPQRPMVPTTPVQRLAAYLLELWGDEFWLPPAMHYRWNFEENVDQLLMPEAGRALLPLAPRPLQRIVARKLGATPRSFLPGLGVRADQLGLIEAWTESMCDRLDAHFAQHPYLLGSRACIADFGLIGPLYAHLGRDPYPARELIGKRRHLAAWVQRVQQPDAAALAGRGSFLADDALPETLSPIFASIFGELSPFLEATLAQMHSVLQQRDRSKPLPRALGVVTCPYGEDHYRQQARSFVLWKWQRLRDVMAALSPPQREATQRAFSRWPSLPLLTTTLPRMRREALQVRLEC